MKKICLLTFVSCFSVIAFSQSVAAPKKAVQPKATKSTQANATTATAGHSFMRSTDGQTQATTQQKQTTTTQQKHEAINSVPNISTKTRQTATKPASRS